MFAPHTSKPYNPLIAGAFFRSGQIEAWGRGIEKITETCKAWGKPEPFYKIRTNEVMIGFNTEPEFGESIGDNIGENIGENIGDSIGENFGDSIGENIGDSIGIGATQSKIIDLIRLNPTVSARAISEEIGIAPRNVEANIQILKKSGLLKREGAAKGGYWILKNL